MESGNLPAGLITNPDCGEFCIFFLAITIFDDGHVKSLFNERGHQVLEWNGELIGRVALLERAGMIFGCDLAHWQ